MRRIITGREWVAGQISGRIQLGAGSSRLLRPDMAVRIGDYTYRVREILDADELIVDRPLWWLAWRWLKATWAVLRG